MPGLLFDFHAENPRNYWPPRNKSDDENDDPEEAFQQDIEKGMHGWKCWNLAQSMRKSSIQNVQAQKIKWLQRIVTTNGLFSYYSKWQQS